MSRITTGMQIIKWAFTALSKSFSAGALAVLSFAVQLVIGYVFLVVFGLGEGLVQVSSGLFDDFEANALRFLFNNTPLIAIYVLVGLASNALFNGAMVVCLVKSIRGQRASIVQALARGLSRLPTTLGWTTVNAIAMTVTNAVPEKLSDVPIVGALVSGISFALDVVWDALTALVLPLIMIEGLNLKASVRRSARLFTQNWGESAAAAASANVLSMVLGIPLVLAVGVYFLKGDHVAVWFLLCVGGMAISSITSAINAAWQSVLYLYVCKGELPQWLPPEDALQKAFR